MVGSPHAAWQLSVDGRLRARLARLATGHYEITHEQLTPEGSWIPIPSRSLFDTEVGAHAHLTAILTQDHPSLPSKGQLFEEAFYKAFAPVLKRHLLVTSMTGPTSADIRGAKYLFRVHGHFGSRTDAWMTIQDRQLLQRILRRHGPISANLLIMELDSRPQPTAATLQTNTLEGTLSLYADFADQLLSLPAQVVDEIWRRARKRRTRIPRMRHA